MMETRLFPAIKLPEDAANVAKAWYAKMAGATKIYRAGMVYSRVHPVGRVRRTVVG